MNKTLAVVGIVVVVGIGLLVIGHPGGGVQTARPPAGQQANVSAAAGGAAEREPAQGLVLQKLGGGTIDLADYKGKEPVVLDFWASWCPNCRRDMPHLNALYQTYKGKVEVIGVNLQEDRGTVERFIASRGVGYPIALDERSEASRAYGIQYTNTHVLIDRNGGVVRVIPGDIQESDITSLIKGREN